MESNSLQQEEQPEGLDKTEHWEHLNPLDWLPWEDILYHHLFLYLTLRELFLLRRVSHQFLDCVSQYLETCRYLNLTSVGPRFNADAFKNITGGCRNLRGVVLRHAKGWLTDSLLVPLFETNLSLQKVDLTSCTAISNASIDKLATCCGGLEELYLRDCHWLMPQGVVVVTLNCPQLKSLDMTGCWQIDDHTVKTVCKLCKELQSLSISKIYGLTDNSISYLAKNCPRLRHLNMQGCWRVTDESVRLLGEYCKELKMLQIRDCADVTDYSIAYIRRRGIRVDVPLRSYHMDRGFVNYISSLKLQV